MFSTELLTKFLTLSNYYMSLRIIWLGHNILSLGDFVLKGIILAGGFGTRLRPLTNYLPKPMVPIIDKPILEYIIALLRKHNILDIAVTLGYKSEHIVRYFGNGSRFGVHIEYSRETKPLGTAGAVKNAEKFLDDDFVVMSGDALTNIDLGRMIAYHNTHSGMVTMAVKSVENTEGLGVLKLDDEGKIVDFQEKPLVPISNIVNTGIYVMKREVLDYIPPHLKYDFSHDLFPRILPYMYGYIDRRRIEC